MLPHDRTALIESIVRERLGGIPVHEVRVVPDTDHEGDPVLRVRVVHGGPVPLEGGVGLDVLRDTRSRLMEEGDDAFPIFYWMGPSDSAGLDAHVH